MGRRKIVTKIPRCWMMRRSQKDSFERSWRCLLVCIIFCSTGDFSSPPLLLLLLLVLPPSSLGCSTLSIMFAADDDEDDTV